MKVVASVVVVNEKNELLILRRSKTSSSPGTWNFPGGSVEEGEKNEEAAVRELVEETNLSAFSNDLKYLGTLENKHLIISFYLTYRFEGDLTINSESDAYEWVALDDLGKYKFVGGGKINQDLLNAITKNME